MRRLGRSQRGTTLPEVLVAMVVIVIGMFAGLDGLVSARKTSLSGKGEAQAMDLAQRELERIRALPFDEVVMQNPIPTQSSDTGSPAGDDNPKNPHYYISGNRLKVMKNYGDLNSGTIEDSDSAGESMVHGGSGAVVPQSDVTVGGRQYRIWRFVTYPPPDCIAGLDQVDVSGVDLPTPLPPLLQMRDDLAKRLTVAVLPVDQSSRPPENPLQAGPTRPLYLSTIIVKPGVALPVPISGGLSC